MGKEELNNKEKELLDRMRKVQKIKGFERNESAFARELQCLQATLNLYLAGKRKFPTMFVVNLLSVYEDISAEWLLRGKGEMLNNVDRCNKTEILENKITQLEKELEKTCSEKENLLKENKEAMTKIIRLQDALLQEKDKIEALERSAMKTVEVHTEHQYSSEEYKKLPKAQ